MQVPLSPASSPIMKPTVCTGICLVPSALLPWGLSKGKWCKYADAHATGHAISNPEVSCLLPASMKLAG